MNFTIQNQENKALDRARVMVEAVEIHHPAYGRATDYPQDLIADLLLYAESIGLDVDETVRLGRMHYEAEREMYFGEEEE